MGPIWQDVQTTGRYQDGQAALDDKQYSPRFNAAVNVFYSVGLACCQYSKC
jgi:hypothetical protein